ncbi:MAG: hypothetical protein ACJ8C4_12895 [Gemmataceae bacterium]
MRVICPHCQKTISVTDTAAGQPTPCPECGNIFTAPTLMAPEPAPVATAAAPAPSGGGVTVTAAAPPSASSSTATLAPEHTPPPISPDLQSAGPPLVHAARFTLSKRVIRWIGPIALVILFFSAFATWIGSYATGASTHPIYTQWGWGTISGGFTSDPIGEKTFGREQELMEQRSFDGLSLLAWLLVIFLIPIGLLDLFRDYVNFAVPDIIQRIWPHRLTVLAATSLLIALIFTLRLLGQPGLESAASAAAEKHTAPATADVAKVEGSPTLSLERDLRRGEEFNRYGLRRTAGLWIGYLASLVAVIGFALEWWLDRRGKRRAPAVEVQW